MIHAVHHLSAHRSLPCCADTKNSVGLVGCIEEVAHNAISIYWNPLESSAKVTTPVSLFQSKFPTRNKVKFLADLHTKNE